MTESLLYEPIIIHIFERYYTKGVTKFIFERSEITTAAKELGIEVSPKHLGDLIYSYRFRRELPGTIRATAPKGKEWTIELAGRARYRFNLTQVNRIIPREDLAVIKIPDATPEIIAQYALNDEQALLAKVRYNRLVDIFLGLTTYSLQNHLRTFVKNVGQIEIDEVYVGVKRSGQQFVIPVQAKGGTDQLSVVQTKQDLACCAEKFPHLECRPISAQFMHEDDTVAMFELTMQDDAIRVLEEKHYRLVPSKEISQDDLINYAQS